VQVLSPCVTFRGDDEYDRIKGVTKQIPSTHDTSNWEAAMKLATEPGENYLGIFYQSNARPAYDEMLTKQRVIATKKQPAEISALIETFK
jgi:pyruvate/2-oxoacid:ferredoxin oxidoreductase beta subunit